MKNINSLVALLLLTTSVWAQSIEIASTTQGFLPPRMTTAQRDAITSPAVGLTIYNTTVNSLQWWNGTLWYNSTTGATGPQGPAGPTGATGPQGPAGPTGPAGNGFTNGTVNNQIMYWNGSAWVTLNPGSNGQTLNLINGSLRWVTPPVVYPVGSVFCSGGATLVFDVTNPITNKTWMDRNLGAKQVATTWYNDNGGFGDLYQWGRRSDGHQCRSPSSRDTLTLSSLDQPAHGHFITPIDLPYDWRSPQNTNLWQGIDGVNNPCPSGYRLPTETELNQERLSWSSNSPAGAFASVLKLSTANSRPNYSIYSFGYYWSSTVNGTFSRTLNFYSFYSKSELKVITGAEIGNYNRRNGCSVRCIKD